MYEEVFSGLNQDPKEYFETIFSEDHEELVLVKDIPFYSCVNIILFLFMGKPMSLTIPRNGKVTGLSKLARAVEAVLGDPSYKKELRGILLIVFWKNLIRMVSWLLLKQSICV